MDQKAIDRFWSNVDRRGPDECWPWLLSKQSRGYGVACFGGDGRRELAHRVAFFLEHGRWPEPMCLHRCDNRPCCNPGHLFEGEAADNSKDMSRKGRAPNRKLTAAQVSEIKAAGGSHYALARKYGVHARAIWAILNGETWRHL